MSVPSAKDALTWEMLEKTLEVIYRPQKRPEPNCRIDFESLVKHGIGFCWESEDLVLFSSDGLRRAKEVGAVLPL